MSLASAFRQSFLGLFFAILGVSSSATAQTVENPLLLGWDTGATEAGTVLAGAPSPAAGQYYFRINTRSAKVWRTRLMVTSGEAHLYLAKGQLPVPGAVGTRASVIPGSDGIVLSDKDFGVGQDWFILVEASGPASAWSLVSGDPHVRDLGTLPFTDTNSDGTYNIGEPSADGGVAGQIMPPEGVVFFKVTLPSNVPAWALWMSGGNQVVGVRKNQLPILFESATVADRKQSGSLLLVPPYLGQGSDSYFVSVTGTPGSAYSMDSRIQPINDIAFDGTTSAITVTGSPYQVFRVEVPAEQVIWDLSLNRISGDPNICVRKQTVPSETDNDAFSEAAGAADDSITLVSPDLTNGIWFITLYGAGSYSVNLKSGTPAITDIGYRATVSNDQPERSGWRYYRIPDIASQLGTLGWQLELDDAPPGTQISIRRALAPGTWKRRINGATSVSSVRHVDFSSASGILQRVDHEADIWYVGVYQPEVALGNFTLTLRDIAAVPAPFDEFETTVTDQLEGEWRYFRINVPEDPTLLGWYLDLAGVVGDTTANISVRRDRLPPAPAGFPAVSASSSAWPSGSAWVQTTDFTGIMKNKDGSDVSGHRFLAAVGTNRPLQPGTYYVGVLAGNAQPAAGLPKKVCYTLRSRGIGGGYAIPVTPLSPSGGTAALNDLAPRDFRFYSLTLAADSQVSSWNLRLNPSAGEMHMQVRRDSLPDFFPSALVGEINGTGSVLGGKRLKKFGPENLTLLPDHGQPYLTPGTYYAAVISEGLEPTAAALGPDPASGVLSSALPAPVSDVGTLGTGTLDFPFNIPGGEMAFYRVTVPPGARLLETYITGRGGNPGIAISSGTGIPRPFPGNNSGTNGYGWVGGQTAPTHPVLLSVQEPVAGTYTIAVRAHAESNNFPNGTGTLHFRVLSDWPVIEALGAVKAHQITDQIAESWQYFTLSIPDNASIKGVYVSLRNVTSGVPRMIIRKGSGLPVNFTTTFGLDSGSATWPDGAQWGQTNDYTNISKNSTGSVATGRGFLCAYGAPMGPGTYTIGVTKDTTINTVNQPGTPPMSYTIRVDCIGDGLDYDITNLSANNTSSPKFIPALPEREHQFFKITIPGGLSSWRMKLAGSATADLPPLAGDGMLTIRRDHIPAFDTGATPSLKGGATARLISQDDHWVLLPSTSASVLEGGEYYVAVTSLGVQPSGSQTGPGACDLTFTTRGEMPAHAIFPLQTDEDTSAPFDLGPAEVAAYQFTVPARAAGLTPYGFRIRIDRSLGKSNFSVRLSGPDGSSSPIPPGPGSDGFVGGLPALYSSTDPIPGQIVYQALPGVYRVIVRSTGTPYTGSTGSLAVRLIDSGAEIPTLAFDGESFTVSNAGSVTDILPFRVVIPDEPKWQAWGIRLVGPHSGKPALFIKREEPVDAVAGPLVDSDSTEWPPLHQWTQLADYTKLQNDPFYGSSTDKDRSQQYFVAARGRPLQPGTYYIGIDNRGTPVISPRSFTLQTFAFGEGYTIPVSDLSEVGSSVDFSIADPRMPSVHKITIPPNVRSWAVSLSATLGDFTLRVRKDFIPDTNNSTNPNLKGGVHIQKAGDERFTLLPLPGNDFIPPGDYYIAAVSEGQNSSIVTKTIGIGEASGRLTNLGAIPINDLGVIGESGITHAISLAPAEVKLFTIAVPPGINNLQFRLNDRSGDASIAVIQGTRVPAPALTETYGLLGGQTGTALKKDKAIVNLSNPVADTYTIAIRAGGTAPSSYAPASATLAIDILKPATLNFSETLNIGNGASHIDARSLADKEKYFYRVAIPEQLEGSEILGWMVTMDLGSPIVRFYRSADDFGKTPPVTMAGRTALIVPPLLSPGSNWYIEVEGVGTTDYIIRSEPVALVAMPWILPAAFNEHAGDSNPGEPEGVGIGRELAQDHWNFYALNVPENNLGLMRLFLEASNGNPNVYVRHGGIPTTDHRVSGTSGTPLYTYKMIGLDSEAGNFSAISDTGLQPERLEPGRWYIGVKSDPIGSTRTSSRYRIKAHSGIVTDIDLETAVPLTAQNLPEKDWRYYRVTIPRDGLPARWLPAFTRLSGNAQLYIRDTLPPFSYVRNTSTSAITFNHWGTDAKNNLPTGKYQSAVSSGTTELPVPPLRPGHTYFLGLYGASGGSFDLSSSVSSQHFDPGLEMAYNTGARSFTVSPGASQLIRFQVPAEATRIKFDTLQSAIGMRIKLEQGAPPDPATTVTAHMQNASNMPASYSANRLLGTTWPFVPGQDYYLLLLNTTTSPINASVTMNGVNALTEDEDGDGIPDAWERSYFGSHTKYNASADPDNDGSTNLQEYLNGTDPNDQASVLYRLAIAAPGGAFTASPQQETYAKGTLVTLQATPAAGDTFREWSAPGTPLHGSTSPLVTIAVNSNISGFAVFGTGLGKALETPPGQLWTTAGAAAWFGQYIHHSDGVDAASSPPVGANAFAQMSTTLTGPGTLTFRWRVSSRVGHTLSFLGAGITLPTPISGLSMPDWATVSVEIPHGDHEVTWRYHRPNSNLPQGEDRGWVDNLTYTGFPSAGPTFASWIQEKFTSIEQADPTISGPHSDPDGDGISNLLEAALGTSPKSADAMDDVLKLTRVSVSGGNRTVHLTSLVASQAIGNITLTLEMNPELPAGGWVPLASRIGGGLWGASPSTVVTQADTATNRSPVEFQETVPAASSARRFYRLRAELAQ